MTQCKSCKYWHPEEDTNGICVGVCEKLVMYPNEEVGIRIRYNLASYSTKTDREKLAVTYKHFGCRVGEESDFCPVCRATAENTEAENTARCTNSNCNIKTFYI